MKSCRYRYCKSTTYHSKKSFMKNITFYPFPNPRNQRNKSIRWIKACGLVNFTVDDLTKWTYICSKHFVGGQGPTEEHPDPLPLTVAEEMAANSNGKIKRTENGKNGVKVNGKIKKTHPHVDDGVKVNGTIKPAQNIVKVNGNNQDENEDSNKESTDFFNLNISTITHDDAYSNYFHCADDSRISNDIFPFPDERSEKLRLLNSLHRDLFGLKDWGIFLKDDTLQFHILCDRNATSVKAVIVDMKLDIQIKVLNNELPSSHLLWKHVPAKNSVRNSSTLLNTLNLVKSWTVCNGINDVLVKWFRNSISEKEKPFFVFKTESLHSVKCDLLYSSIQIKCDKCIDSEKKLHDSMMKEERFYSLMESYRLGHTTNKWPRMKQSIKKSIQCLQETKKKEKRFSVK
uniref:THAP-type domain-containing protein n=1 Tax=Strigamia maritima TaxID=126957 RepID=T1IZP6_STRMM